jgi:hypothetical protein
MSTRSRKIMFMGSRERPVLWADNLTAIYEPTVWRMCDPHGLHGDSLASFSFLKATCAYTPLFATVEVLTGVVTQIYGLLFL